MDYHRFTDDRRKSFLLDRLHALEADHYANELNLRVVKGDDRDRTQEALKVLERSIAVVREELAALPDEE